MTHHLDFQGILGQVKKFRSQSPFDTIMVQNTPTNEQNKTVHNDYTWILRNYTCNISLETTGISNLDRLIVVSSSIKWPLHVVFDLKLSYIPRILNKKTIYFFSFIL